jgi:type IV pilus assembly protein PilP
MNIYRRLLFIPLIFFVGNLNSMVCAKDGLVNPTDTTVSNPPSYEYLVEGRQDPFRPFLSPKAATPTGLDPNEIVDDANELVGMQLFEPGQLTLAGVLLNGNTRLALVEDQTKKGYMIKLGTLIGRRGVVTEIEKSQVIITETAKTRAGKELNTTVIMKLNNEGEK